LFLLATLSGLTSEQRRLFEVFLIADKGFLNRHNRLLCLGFLLYRFFTELFGYDEGEGDCRRNQDNVAMILIKLLNFFKLIFHTLGSACKSFKLASGYLLDRGGSLPERACG
jgi:hypothetical protein